MVTIGGFTAMAWVQFLTGNSDPMFTSSAKMRDSVRLKNETQVVG